MSHIRLPPLILEQPQTNLAPRCTRLERILGLSSVTVTCHEANESVSLLVGYRLFGRELRNALHHDDADVMLNTQGLSSTA